jgi:hypothetical protein
MFNRKNTYQYGSDPKHTVRLSTIEAYAINNLRVYNLDVETGHAQINADEIDMRAYDRAATKLNAYIANHGGSIPCTDEYLEANDILTRIK